MLLVSGRVSVPKPLSQIQRGTRRLLQGLSPRTSFGGFGFSGIDEFGNEITDASDEWVASDGVGEIDQKGVLTAGTTAGVHQAAATVEVNKGTSTQRASAEVTIKPGPLERVVISPGYAKVVPGGQQQFIARAVDAFGNEIEGLQFSWESSGAGDIDTMGLFTAGSLSGRFLNDVRITAVENGRQESGTAAIDVSLSGVGTAIIDGEFGDDEWNGAGRLDFLANIPEGGTTPASLFAMNDTIQLYLALKIQRSSLGGSTNPVFEFDNDNDGDAEPGDDTFGMSAGIFQAAAISDGFRTTCDGAPPGTAGCAPGDFAEGGTTDGMAAASNDGVFTFVELSHPLDGDDDLHDFSLRAGDSVGFFLGLRLFSLDPSQNQTYADTDMPGIRFSPYLEIVIAE